MPASSIHDSINSSEGFLNDQDEFEIVSVISDSELHPQLNMQPLGLTAYHSSDLQLPKLPPEPVPAPGCLEKFETACLSPEDVQTFVKRWVDGEEDEEDVNYAMDESLAPLGTQTDALRGYKINKPPKMRPVRVYIAALYDVLHPGHVLNLRQAKYSFPSVHLLVGVFAEAPPHAPAIFSHLERLETVRHIRYIDELIPEAPLQLTESFLREWNIDYVAYEEDTQWNDPGYQLARKLGKFLPLRSTGAISTGEVLQRLRGESDVESEGNRPTGLKRQGTIGTIRGNSPGLKVQTEFIPMTPASYQDEGSPIPEPSELLDPFTN